MQKAYTVKEVARILGFSTNSIYAFLKDGRIQGVRLGKGRFRIPEDELARVMHLAKKPESPAIVPNPSLADVTESSPAPAPAPAPAPVSVAMRASDVPPTVQEQPKPLATIHHLDAVRLFSGDLLSLFDWFIAGLAVVVSCTLLLFSATNLLGIGVNAIVIGAVVVLLASAVGLIVTDFWKGITSSIRFPFLVGIAVGLLLLCIVSIGQGYALYGILLATFVFSLIIAMFSGLRTMVALCIGTCVFVIAYPLVSILQQSYVYFPFVATLGNPARIILANGIAVAWIGLCLSAWASRRNHRIISTILFSSLSLVLFCISIAHAINTHWSEAFVLLWIALLLPVLPYWDFLRNKKGRVYIVVTSGYLLILFSMVCSIFVVYFMQQSSLDSARNQVQTNLSIGKQNVEAIAGTDSDNIKNIADNDAFINAFQEGDLLAMQGYLLSVLDDRGAINSLYVLNVGGQVVTSYPIGLDDGAAFGLREYVTRAITSRTLVTSDIQAQPGLPVQYGFVYAMPLETAQHEIIGVVVARANIASYQLALSRAANLALGEEFWLTDSQNRIISHTDESRMLASFDTLEHTSDKSILTNQQSLQIPHWDLHVSVRVPLILRAIHGFWFLLGGLYLFALFIMVFAGFFIGFQSTSTRLAISEEHPG